jgi:hypothetical protein
MATSSVMFLAIVSGEVPAEKEEAVPFRFALCDCPWTHGKTGTDFYVLQFITAET